MATVEVKKTITLTLSVEEAKLLVELINASDLTDQDSIVAALTFALTKAY